MSNNYEKLENLLDTWEFSHCGAYLMEDPESKTLKELLIYCRTEAIDGADYHKEGGEKERILNKTLRRWETLSEISRDHVIESLKQQETRYQKYLNCIRKINAYLVLLRKEEFILEAFYNPKTALGRAHVNNLYNENF